MKAMISSSEAGTTVRPSGLFMSLASFARNLLPATPTEEDNPTSQRMRRFSSFAMATASPPHRCNAPLTSKKASSRDNGSTSGVNDSKIRMIWLEMA